MGVVTWSPRRQGRRVGGASPRRALGEVASVAVLLTAVTLGVHAHLCDEPVTGQVLLLAGALLVASWLVESVHVPVGLDRVGRVQLMSGVNAVLLPAAVLLPPTLFVVVGVGSALPLLRGVGVVGTLSRGAIRASQMCAAALALYATGPWQAEIIDVGTWMELRAVLSLILAGAVMLVAESLLEAGWLRVGEGLLPEDVRWFAPRAIVAETPEVAIGSLAVVLMAAPAAIVLLVPLFLLENRMLRAHAAHLCGYRDGKTGLLTLTAFDDLATGELSRARRTGQPVAVLMLDVDGLKRVNRTKGHLAGDRVVIAVADLLMTHSRREDLVCRFGGDEFCVMLPGASLGDASLVAERIRVAARGPDIAGLPGAAHLSMSAGVAVAEPSDDVTTLLSRADEGLLAAKQRGGNRVRVVAPQPA